MERAVEQALATIPEMRARYEDARSRYVDLAHRTTGSIRKFEWCATPRYSLSLFELERLGWTRGRPMMAEPKSKDGKHRYGFDAEGRILLEEQFTEFEGQRYETFWEHSRDRIDCTHFGPWREKPVINVECLCLRNGLATTFVRYAEHGFLAEYYEFAEGVLSRAVQAAREHDPKSLRHELTVVTDAFAYSGEQLERIARTWESGETEILFSRRRSRK
jgi:hypothetical protein